jgi:P-type Ca2+ transporter type 2C
MDVAFANIAGLTSDEVDLSRSAHGRNELKFRKPNKVWTLLKKLASEPMVILLLAAALIYFVTGHTDDGVFMVVAIILVWTISSFQDSRSNKALEKLKQFTHPLCKVIRNGRVAEIPTEEVVIGDSLVVSEGMMIAADGKIIHSNDFQVSEASLTGESLPVYKSGDHPDPFVYQGTLVTGGLAIATVTAIGNLTKFGSIGRSLVAIRDEKTPLEKQISNFVKKMVIAGAIIFVLVWVLNFLRSREITDSLMKALTLAMSVLPEEIPVAFTTFMALGAFRLMRTGVIVKQMKTVETLGSATVICTDKTGTITENRMALAAVVAFPRNRVVQQFTEMNDQEREVLELAMWASEPIPFDPMEKALHEAYGKYSTVDARPGSRMIHEYPLGGHPPMMTHLFTDAKGTKIIAAKGALEAFTKMYPANNDTGQLITTAREMSDKGYRVLAVARSHYAGELYPRTQQELPFELKGLVAFYDPPKKNMNQVWDDFYKAGIEIKLISGDNAATTTAIARETGFRGYDKNITGDELMKLDDAALRKTVHDYFVFSRMFPDAKMRIIEALKVNGEIVAMTGDGINDAPALKAAHIGIAMGKKGTETAKQAASLVLQDDDLSKMVDAVAQGRKIYSNLKKAIQYIISIHIPIILTVFIPLVLGWIYPNIFTPVHVIFMELIMGPTCSIIYENEPMEKNLMQQKPRPLGKTFFNWRELTLSIVQGLVITAGTLSTYQYAVSQGYDEVTTRSMVFTTLITANIFLTLVNRSFYYSMLTTLRYRNSLVPLIILITILLTAALLYITPVAEFFGFAPIPLSSLGIVTGIGFISATWFEIVKWASRVR